MARLLKFTLSLNISNRITYELYLLGSCGYLNLKKLQGHKKCQNKWLYFMCVSSHRYCWAILLFLRLSLASLQLGFLPTINVVWYHQIDSTMFFFVQLSFWYGSCWFIVLGPRSLSINVIVDDPDSFFIAGDNSFQKRIGCVTYHKYRLVALGEFLSIRAGFEYRAS